MIRQLAFRQATALRTGLVPANRYISTSPGRYSIIGSAKDVLNKANKKIGEVAAEGIDKTQHVNPDPHSVKDAAQKVNKKTGEVLAEGIDGTQKAESKVRVSQHSKGYKDLQDKGSKTESEQNRPDDAV